MVMSAKKKTIKERGIWSVEVRDFFFVKETPDRQGEIWTKVDGSKGASQMHFWGNNILGRRNSKFKGLCVRNRVPGWRMSRNDVRKVIRNQAGHVGLVPLGCLWLDSVKWGVLLDVCEQRNDLLQCNISTGSLASVLSKGGKARAETEGPARRP